MVELLPDRWKVACLIQSLSRSTARRSNRTKRIPKMTQSAKRRMRHKALQINSDYRAPQRNPSNEKSGRVSGTLTYRGRIRHSSPPTSPPVQKQTSPDKPSTNPICIIQPHGVVANQISAGTFAQLFPCPTQPGSLVPYLLHRSKQPYLPNDTDSAAVHQPNAAVRRRTLFRARFFGTCLKPSVAKSAYA